MHIPSNLLYSSIGFSAVSVLHQFSLYIFFRIPKYLFHSTAAYLLSNYIFNGRYDCSACGFFFFFFFIHTLSPLKREKKSEKSEGKKMKRIFFKKPKQLANLSQNNWNPLRVQCQQLIRGEEFCTKKKSV